MYTKGVSTSHTKIYKHKTTTMVRRRIFLVLPLLFTFLYTTTLASVINWNATAWFVEVPWMIILTFLNFNLFLISFAAIFSFWSSSDKVLGDDEIEGKKVALVYSLKNEDDLYEKLRLNAKNNTSVLSEIIIISNSDDSVCIAEEKEALRLINQIFDIPTTHYPAQPPKHVGIYSFFSERTDLEYIATCDADTIYPEGSIVALMKRAFHPENGDVAIWQSHSVATPGITRFGRVMGAGQQICAKLYAHGFYMAMGQSGYYGSGALIHRESFAEAGDEISKNKVVPVSDIKSHDVWEATILPKLGKQIRYVKEIETLEDFPQTYVEMIKRDQRWMKGTLQSFKSLWVLPHKNTLATFFFVLNPIFLYLIQPVYLLWMGLGVMRFFYSDLFNFELQVMSIAFILGLLFFQKFLAARSWKDIKTIFLEQTFSSIFYINTPVFTTINLLKLGIKEEWIPMAKKVKQNSLISILNKFLINEVVGYWGILFVFFNISLQALVFFPIFFLFMISGLISYYFQFVPNDNKDREQDNSGYSQDSPLAVSS
jgi:membrane glycosyltransferase